MKFSELRGERKAEQKKAWRECQRQHKQADYQHEVSRDTTLEELLSRRHQINKDYQTKLNRLLGR